MSIIDVTIDNIDKEHICCAIADKKGENCVGSKKAWMRERFDDGLVFKKLDARGKVFIEYIPAEKAFAPISAPDYMYINCFWVSGRYKGQGYGSQLLEACIEDAKVKGKKGLAVLSATKKKPFLSDPKYMKQKGFLVADKADPYYELLYLPFDGMDETNKPSFIDHAKSGTIEETDAVIYYSNQCPHTDKYIPIVEQAAKDNNIPLKVVKITTTKEAQAAPTPFTTYSFFKDGDFVTNEILTEKKFLSFFI